MGSTDSDKPEGNDIDKKNDENKEVNGDPINERSESEINNTTNNSSSKNNIINNNNTQNVTGKQHSSNKQNDTDRKTSTVNNPNPNTNNNNNINNCCYKKASTQPTGHGKFKEKRPGPLNLQEIPLDLSNKIHGFHSPSSLRATHKGETFIGATPLETPKIVWEDNRDLLISKNRFSTSTISSQQRLRLSNSIAGDSTPPVTPGAFMCSPVSANPFSALPIFGQDISPPIRSFLNQQNQNNKAMMDFRASALEQFNRGAMRSMYNRRSCSSDNIHTFSCIPSQMDLTEHQQSIQCPQPQTPWSPSMGRMSATKTFNFFNKLFEPRTNKKAQISPLVTKSVTSTASLPASATSANNRFLYPNPLPPMSYGEQAAALARYFNSTKANQHHQTPLTPTNFSATANLLNEIHLTSPTPQSAAILQTGSMGDLLTISGTHQIPKSPQSKKTFSNAAGFEAQTNSSLTGSTSVGNGLSNSSLTSNLIPNDNNSLGIINSSQSTSLNTPLLSPNSFSAKRNLLGSPGISPMLDIQSPLFKFPPPLPPSATTTTTQMIVAAAAAAAVDSIISSPLPQQNFNFSPIMLSGQKQDQSQNLNQLSDWLSVENAERSRNGQMTISINGSDTNNNVDNYLETVDKNTPTNNSLAHLITSAKDKLSPTGKRALIKGTSNSTKNSPDARKVSSIESQGETGNSTVAEMDVEIELDTELDKEVVVDFDSLSSDEKNEKVILDKTERRRRRKDMESNRSIASSPTKIVTSQMRAQSSLGGGAGTANWLQSCDTNYDESNNLTTRSASTIPRILVSNYRQGQQQKQLKESQLNDQSTIAMDIDTEFHGSGLANEGSNNNNNNPPRILNDSSSSQLVTSDRTLTEASRSGIIPQSISSSNLQQEEQNQGSDVSNINGNVTTSRSNHDLSAVYLPSNINQTTRSSQRVHTDKRALSPQSFRSRIIEYHKERTSSSSAPPDFTLCPNGIDLSENDDCLTPRLYIERAQEATSKQSTGADGSHEYPSKNQPQSSAEVSNAKSKSMAHLERYNPSQTLFDSTLDGYNMTSNQIPNDIQMSRSQSAEPHQTPNFGSNCMRPISSAASTSAFDRSTCQVDQDHPLNHQPSYHFVELSQSAQHLSIDSQSSHPFSILRQDNTQSGQQQQFKTQSVLASHHHHHNQQQLLQHSNHPKSWSIHESSGGQQSSGPQLTASNSEIRSTAHHNLLTGLNRAIGDNRPALSAGCLQYPSDRDYLVAVKQASNASLHEQACLSQQLQGNHHDQRHNNNNQHNQQHQHLINHHQSSENLLYQAGNAVRHSGMGIGWPNQQSSNQQVTNSRSMQFGISGTGQNNPNNQKIFCPFNTNNQCSNTRSQVNQQPQICFSSNGLLNFQQPQQSPFGRASSAQTNGGESSLSSHRVPLANSTLGYSMNGSRASSADSWHQQQQQQQQQQIGASGIHQLNHRSEGSGIHLSPQQIQIQSDSNSSNSLDSSCFTNLSSISSQTATAGLQHQSANNKLKINMATKKYHCDQCSKSFTRSDMLTRHKRLHSGDRPFQCSECHQGFSRSDHLSTHMRTHTGEKPYSCEICHYSACRKDMITRHLKIHEKAKNGSPNNFIITNTNGIGSLSLSAGNSRSNSRGSSHSSHTSQHVAGYFGTSTNITGNNNHGAATIQLGANNRDTIRRNTKSSDALGL